MNKKILKWERWLDEIKQQIRSLLWSRQIYNETFDIIRANPLLPNQNSLYGAMQMWYSASALSGIRRQLKSGDQSISLAGLLEDIRDNPALLSRARWLKLHEGFPLPGHADQVFRQYAGDGDFINPAIVETDLLSLKEISTKCEAYSDKRVAHHDKGTESEVPTYEELDATLASLDALFRKYFVLVTAKNALTDTSIAYNWKQVFRHPWIPPAT
ncbi:hypothetical protein [Gemmatimonas sp.]|uniref:hypothetical protein n=1 Tax=Gemmatimonas sp. TaxID=1962908 RepID=UPI003340E967